MYVKPTRNKVELPTYHASHVALLATTYNKPDSIIQKPLWSINYICISDIIHSDKLKHPYLPSLAILSVIKMILAVIWSAFTKTSHLTFSARSPVTTNWLLQLSQCILILSQTYRICTLCIKRNSLWILYNNFFVSTKNYK